MPSWSARSISETNTPERGTTRTVPSSASRCSASRIGVRPMFRRLLSETSEILLPGGSSSVTIISSISR